MAIFDRYLLLVFAKVLGVCFISFTGLYVVIDVFNHIESFLAAGEEADGLLYVLIDYYGARMLTFGERMSAVLSLVAGLFVLTWMQRTNELTAVLAAGVSRARVVTPLLGAVLVISLLGIVNREWVIPQFREQLSRDAQDWSGSTRQAVHPRYDNETDIYLSGRATVASEKKIVEPNLRLPGALASFGRQLQAEAAYYLPRESDRPSGYLLTQVHAPADIDQLPSGRIGDQIVLYTPKETPWLEPRQCFLASRVDFEQLAGGDSWRRYSSSWQLIAALRNPSLDYGADVRLAIHSRIVQPLLDMMLFLIGLPLVFSERSRNIFMSIGLCSLMVIVFQLIVLGCQALGNNYLLSPSMAAWCPVLILAPVTYFLASPIWE
jgi:lipopolysaccharide export system permease protein